MSKHCKRSGEMGILCAGFCPFASQKEQRVKKLYTAARNRILRFCKMVRIQFSKTEIMRKAG